MSICANAIINNSQAPIYYYLLKIQTEFERKSDAPNAMHTWDTYLMMDQNRHASDIASIRRLLNSFQPMNSINHNSAKYLYAEHIHTKSIQSEREREKKEADHETQRFLPWYPGQRVQAEKKSSPDCAFLVLNANTIKH